MYHNIKMGPKPKSGDDSLAQTHSILKWIGGDNSILTPAMELSRKNDDKFLILEAFALF